MQAEGLPILHIVDAAADALAKHTPRGTIGLMGTAATLRMRLYQDRLEARGWTCIVPTEAEMQAKVSPGIALVKANRVAEAYAPLAETVQALAARGADAVVLGCTELPLAITAAPPGMDLVDPLVLQCRACVDFALADFAVADLAGADEAP